MSNRQLALTEYIVRILPPDGEVENEVMDEALRVAEASIGHALQKLVHETFIKGVDSLGKRGFTVEVINSSEEVL